MNRALGAARWRGSPESPRKEPLHQASPGPPPPENRGRNPGRSLAVLQGRLRVIPARRLDTAAALAYRRPVFCWRKIDFMVSASHVLDRVLVLEMVRVTEAAAV